MRGDGICALSLFARAVQAMSVGAQTKISIDAPGHSTVPLAILVMFIGGMVNLAQIRLVLGRVFQRLTAQALTDPLTGTVNRRGPMSQIEELHLRAAHGGDGYVVLMLDLDHFKAVNDRHGHPKADRVLKRVAQNLHEGLRVGNRLEQVIQRAEATLYQAKEAGRNRVVVAADMVPAWQVGTRSTADAPQAP